MQVGFKYLDDNGLQYFWNKIKAKLNLKQDTLVSGTNIKTINNASILGSGNIDISGSGGLTILSYGNSTWNDFITAYNNNSIVYCRASSNSNPATGSQTRLAFMAYVNNASNPTNVEFQYYRSMSSHSATNQGDQVYVYKLESAGTWTVTTREASSKIVAGTNMSSTYSNGTLTLSATDTTYSNATTSSAGLMSATDKTNLDTSNSLVEGSYRTATMQHPIVVREWNTSGAYYLDNFVIYNNHIYRCIVNEATAGSFVTNEWAEKDLLNWCFENTNYLNSMQSDLDDVWNYCELTENKVTSISSSSTNTQYPSALAVYNYINSLNGNGVSY